MSSLIKSVERAIQKHRLLPREQSVLVAVSGGLDSMVLLRVLHALATRHDWRLVVAHFNHRLRGRSSDADEALVRKVTAELGLKFVSGRRDVRAWQRREKLSLEMAARQCRHEFLARAARRLGCETIALAHHADDQVELFYLRLLRGSGGAGLAGMAWSNCSPVDAGIRLVRPLLAEAKAALAQFAGAGKILYHEDASNASHDILRNRVRHQLLPWLVKNFQPALTDTTLRVMDILGANADFVERAAQKWRAAKRRKGFETLPVAVQRSCLSAELIKLGLEPNFDLIERLREKSGTFISVERDGLVARSDEGCVKFHTVKKYPTAAGALKVKLVSPRGRADLGGVSVHWRIRPCKKLVVPKAGGAGRRELFDADLIGSSIVLRHWQPGDRFQPIGMSASVKLQDLFTNQKIPRSERHKRLVAATAGGEIFWVEGLRISEKFKLRSTTSRLLEWRWESSPAKS